MALRSQVPKFGNWENEEDVPYTAYFEKAKKARHAKTKSQIHDPSSNNQIPFQNREEAEFKHGDSIKSENASKEESDIVSNPRRTSRQSGGGGGGGSDRSFDSSPMHSHQQQQQQPRSGNRGSSGSYEGNHAPASSTPGRSKLKQVSRGGDETLDDGTAIPKFGGWDEKDPASAEGYTHIFNKAREDRHNGGGKSPMVSTDNAIFYGQNQHGNANANSKGCGCFPWGKK